MHALERAIELTGRLVAFDTESAKSNLPLIDYVADYLREHGVPFTRAPNAAGDKLTVDYDASRLTPKDVQSTLSRYGMPLSA